MRPHGNQSDHLLPDIASVQDIFNRNQERTESYAMADGATDDQFEAAAFAAPEWAKRASQHLRSKAQPSILRRAVNSSQVAEP